MSTKHSLIDFMIFVSCCGFKNVYKKLLSHKKVKAKQMSGAPDTQNCICVIKLDELYAYRI